MSSKVHINMENTVKLVSVFQLKIKLNNTWQVELNHSVYIFQYKKIYMTNSTIHMKC